MKSSSRPYRLVPVASDTEERQLLSDLIHWLSSNRSAGFAILALLVNYRNWVPNDDKTPEGLIVVDMSDEDKFNVGYNFEVLKHLSNLSQVELFKIPLLKIPLGHYSARFKELLQTYPRECVGRASDMVVAQRINTAVLAEDGIILPVPELFGFPADLTLEEYCQLLADGDQSGVSASEISCEDFKGRPLQVGGKASPELRELLKDLTDEQGFIKLDLSDVNEQVDGQRLNSATREIIENTERALREAGEKSLKERGWLAGEGELFIESLNRQPQLTWAAHMHGIYGRHRSRKRQISKNRPSRRGEDYFGRIHLRKISCLWVIDTSGSMGERELRSVTAELRALHAKGCDVWIAQVDAGVAQDPVPYNGHDPIERFVGRGGTDFRPAFELAEKMYPTPEFIVYFTDGYGLAPKEPPRIDTLWVLTSTGCTEEEFKSSVCDWGEIAILDVGDD